MRTSLFRFVLVGIGLLGGSSRLAADDALVLRFPQVKLSDGRELKDVIVKSYDAKSEKLLVLANGKAMTLPVALFPAPLNERLKGAPAGGGTVNTFSAPPRPIASAADQYQLERAAPARPLFRPTPAPSLPVNPAILTGQQETVARARAERYYTYEYPAHMTSHRVTLLDVELQTPVPVPGWAGRSSAQGKAFIELYDTRNRSTQRTTSVFEVLLEEKPGESLRAIDFTVKS